MYINIQTDIKCSNCGAVNNYHDYTKKENTLFNHNHFKSQQIRQCNSCKHESVISETSWNDNRPQFFNYTPPKEIHF